jgi:hypothetical protein
MGVWMTGELEPSDYWQDVCALANELLTASPLRDWTVVVAPEANREAQHSSEWNCRLNRDAKELAVGVPSDSDDPAESEPEEVATYIVFDLLYERVSADGSYDN